MNKLKSFFSKNKKKVALVGMCLTLVFAMCSSCFAASGDVPDLSPIMSALTDAFTIDTIIEIIASVIGYAMPFFLMWFAYRFLKRAYIKAVTAGRL